VPALQSGSYELTWEKRADLPSPLYFASVALHDNKIYTMASMAPDGETHNYVYVYDNNNNQWGKLSPPGQYKGTLQIIDSKVTIIGGWVDTTQTKKRTNKVTTFINNRWINYYPNMLKARVMPGVLSHLDYVIAVGGGLDDMTFSDDIEVFNYKQSPHWVIARIKLPEPMWRPSLTISGDLLYIVGYHIASDKSRAVYQLPVDTITSSAAQLLSNQTAYWTELPSVPYNNTAILPNSCPPVIIGGSVKGVPTVDIRVLDVSKNSWKKIASLTFARSGTAVIPINHDSILVIGGYTGGKSIEEIKANVITTVEKGIVRLCHTQ